MQEEFGRIFANPESLVFSSNDGTLRTYNGTRTIFNRFLKANHLYGKGIHFHALRHTYATMLFENRKNPKVVQLLMGHKDIETTLGIYTHISSPILNDAVLCLDKSFFH